MKKQCGKKRLILVAVSVLILALLVAVATTFYLSESGKLSTIVSRFFGGDFGKVEIIKMLPADENNVGGTLVLPDTDGEKLLKCQTFSLEEIKTNENIVYNQSLILVNTDNKIEDDYPADIVEYKDTGVLMNSCILDSYAQLSAAVRKKFDEKLYVSSSYRSAEEQAEVILEVGTETATEVGASEHQTGLALDVYVAYFAGDGFINCDAGKFVNEHCGDYGFIIRYPKNKTDVTKIRYEPWHIRYVGKPHSQIIASRQMALEEYIESYEVGAFYSVGEYVISRQNDFDNIKIPEGASEVVVSEDNLGNVFVTAKFVG